VEVVVVSVNMGELAKNRKPDCGSSWWSEYMHEHVLVGMDEEMPPLLPPALVVLMFSKLNLLSCTAQWVFMFTRHLSLI
jgi:hypothetical protein